MTIPDSAINATKAVLAKCAANDPWFPQAAQATILAWAEQFVIAKIPLDDLLDAVTRLYATNATNGRRYQPLPADIIAVARATRADRAQRESDAERDARRERQDSKAVADQPAIVRAGDSPWAYGRMGEQCPSCKAAPGVRCIDPATGRQRRMPCLSRLVDNNSKEPPPPRRPMQRRRQWAPRASCEPVRAFSEPVHGGDA